MNRTVMNRLQRLEGAQGAWRSEHPEIDLTRLTDDELERLWTLAEKHRGGAELTAEEIAELEAMDVRFNGETPA
ncbi:hypothetical protein [Azospirillum sp. TSO22-1]|uniref:hypothetical protein n=1 Tax=Azospirillum sp. TSO22-1 TaxID=716789 RepID=UPI000D6084BE|nr:hypothetical protein [Azospirillum sp. TSO22-1]PWC53613.1 hypothetical protein TSO221_10315 [Azospirillum sp. TSO22-1]